MLLLNVTILRKTIKLIPRQELGSLQRNGDVKRPRVHNHKAHHKELTLCYLMDTLFNEDVEICLQSNYDNDNNLSLQRSLFDVSIGSN